MKKIYYFSCFIILMVVLDSCSSAYEVPNDLIVNDFVWKGLNAYYLHQNEIEDLSDRRFSSDDQLNNYLKAFNTSSDLFSNLLLSSDSKSRLVEDYTIFNEPTMRMEKGFQFGAFIEPGTSNNLICYVLYVLPDSDAKNKNLKRGDFFNEVNGIQLTRSNISDLLISNPTTELTLTIIDFDGNSVTSTGNTITFRNETYNSPPILIEETITLSGENIGYMMYNNDFSQIYLDDINQSILNFKSQSINKFILDLRYNIGRGGFARNIAKLGAMLSEQLPSEIFLKEQWNNKAQAWFLENQPDSLLTKFPEKINISAPINSLNLSDLYIILNGDDFSGSSAIELLINSLNPYLNVHIVGNNTAGNNTGTIRLYNSFDYDFTLRNKTHTFALDPIVLNFYNNNDVSYIDGFAPTLDLCNKENILNLGALGTQSDPILNRIFEYISNGNIGSSNCDSDNYEYFFNSIPNSMDLGIYIEQDLPNTL